LKEVDAYLGTFLLSTKKDMTRAIASDRRILTIQDGQDFSHEYRT
jgi:hypothetical protein